MTVGAVDTSAYSSRLEPHVVVHTRLPRPCTLVHTGSDFSWLRCKGAVLSHLVNPWLRLILMEPFTCDLIDGYVSAAPLAAGPSPATAPATPPATAPGPTDAAGLPPPSFILAPEAAPTGGASPAADMSLAALSLLAGLAALV